MQIVVKTGTNCNFACVYCSEGDRKLIELKEDVFKKLIDDLPALLEENNDRKVNILWHGGEPLLWGLDKLERSMTYAETRLSSYTLEFTLQTNGYLIDAAYIDLFQRHKVHVGVSLDGYEELQNKNRQTKDGKPTFDVVWNNIQKIRQAGLGGSILMVLNTSQSIDVDKLYKFIEVNTLSCKINPVIPCGRAKNRGDAAEVYKNYVDLMQQLFRKVMDSDKNIVIEPLNKLMDAIITNQPVSECSYSGHCSQNIFCLYADGNVGFCGRDSEEENLSYGNLSERSLLELYHSVNAGKIRARDQYLLEHECKDCNMWLLCHGGCAFEALNFSKKLEASFPFCAERKKHFTYLRTTGLLLLKQRMIREKQEVRMILAEKKKLLEEVRMYARE